MPASKKKVTRNAEVQFIYAQPVGWLQYNERGLRQGGYTPPERVDGRDPRQQGPGVLLQGQTHAPCRFHD